MSYEQLEAKRSRRQDLEDRHGPSDDVRESSLHKRLEQLVISGFDKGLDEVCPHIVGYVITDRDCKLYDDLIKGKITITQYVAGLSDDGLLAVFERQMCLKYR